MAGIAENHHSTLPSKEGALFKRLLKMYEQKQYKSALKIAKQILSNPKCADHGETLAMKGLTLSYLGRKEEAYEDVKRGLKCDLKSYVCWHVYGLLQRGDKKYEEAMKCFVNALKIDKDNVQILRDLATLQIQLRDLDGFSDTRYRIAVLRPSQKSHWLAYAVALHLQGDVNLAIRVMEECRKLAHPERQDDCDVEYGEYILYQLELMLEAGRYHDVVEHSLRYESYIFDQVALMEKRARAFAALERTKEANSILTMLIRRNSENWSYYRQLTFPFEKYNSLLDFCVDMQKTDPYSRTAYKIPLTLTEGEEFRQFIGSYLRRSLEKGLPALFNDIKIVYENPVKAQIAEEEILRIFAEIQSKEAAINSGGGDDSVLPSTLLWLYYYLAQHYDQKKDYDKAMEFIDLAIAHTPTLVESYSFKAKILKHMGDHQAAATSMEEAQSLDTSDRFINYKAGKYLLRANLLERAETILGKFTREGMKPSENLCDMQCFWFMIESARAMKRLGKFGEALKLLHVLDRHFLDIVDDQLDFHAYCLRKSTIESYVKLIRMEDSVRQHKFYVDGAILAAEIYLAIYDKHPSDSDDDDIGTDPSISAAEKRKLKNKQRKAKKKAESEKLQQEAMEKSKAQAKLKKDDDEPAATHKEDLIPEKLAKPDDPLEMACYFLRPLVVLDIPRFDLHQMIFEVYHRKGKHAVALRSLVRMINLEPLNPKLAEYRSLYLDIADNQTGNIPEAIQEIVMEAFAQIKNCQLPVDNGGLTKSGDALHNRVVENHH
ncbi:N-alpha-acetyltransferase 16, NatA auxiliary subunit-like [Paramacrobiotus metropolitanus]|uniref:N-alpha-acetyltransferase 16, NatA auxiliary subunit-like n=1 Tax=Paramacrobiotus metropolitanus TaxID=2943436 RepID=UPI00244564F2|nr:N-alpha-acetyltransferase 16, NatA auxiliary subunit-like [Paramacrobiotus metropolitanus]